MSKQRRSFSPDFKHQAACLVLDQGYSHMEASRSVGVGESVLRRWTQQGFYPITMDTSAKPHHGDGGVPCNSDASSAKNSNAKPPA